MSTRHWNVGESATEGTSEVPESPALRESRDIQTKGDLPNQEPDEKSTLLQQFSRYAEGPHSEANEPVPTTTEATEGHLANLTAEFQKHSQYFTPESRNDSEWIAWVQGALGDEWSEHLAKMENFERERAAWRNRKEDLGKQRLDECRMEVVQAWMEKEMQGWEGERKRWAAEEDCLERENALEIQTIREGSGMGGVQKPEMGEQPEFVWGLPPRQPESVDTFFW